MDNFKLKEQKYFYFIHTMMPHVPFIFNSDCTLREKLIGKQLDDPTLGTNIMPGAFYLELKDVDYKNNYECMLKRVYEFTSFINKHDPRSNVIIMADHGLTLVSNNYKYSIEELEKITFTGYDTFALVKMNKTCQQYEADKLNFANAIRILLGCSFKSKIDLLDRKNFFVDYEFGSFTTGGRFRVRKVESREDEINFFLPTGSNK